MTYNEWRDELKLNLLSVSVSERRRVLDYYAEAYADRRDAGFTEREIVEDFGAPYDAAQRILSEIRGGGYSEPYDEPRYRREERTRRDEEERLRREERARREDEERLRREEQARRDEERLRSIEAEKRRREESRRATGGFQSYNYAEKQNTAQYTKQNKREYGNRSNGGYNDNYSGKDGYNYNSRANAAPIPPAPAKPARRENFTWLFVLLCVIFAIPILAVIIALIAATAGLCVAPFALLISGIATIGEGIGVMVKYGILSGICDLGVGVIIFGVSIVLIPLFIKLAKLLWKLFVTFFRWLKSLFSGKESV